MLDVQRTSPVYLVVVERPDLLAVFHVRKQLAEAFLPLCLSSKCESLLIVHIEVQIEPAHLAFVRVAAPDFDIRFHFIDAGELDFITWLDIHRVIQC